MMVLARWRLARLWPGGALALLVGALAAPGPARASCGDYVRLGDADHHPAPANKPADPGPCHGPHCDRHPDAPPAPPSTLATPVERWGCIAHPVHVGATAPGFLAGPGGAARPVKPSSSVYHPPRVSASSPSV